MVRQKKNRKKNIYFFLAWYYNYLIVVIIISCYDNFRFMSKIDVPTTRKTKNAKKERRSMKNLPDEHWMIHGGRKSPSFRVTLSHFTEPEILQLIHETAPIEGKITYRRIKDGLEFTFPEEVPFSYLCEISWRLKATVSTCVPENGWRRMLRPTHMLMMNSNWIHMTIIRASTILSK